MRINVSRQETTDVVYIISRYFYETLPICYAVPRLSALSLQMFSGR